MVKNWADCEKTCASYYRLEGKYSNIVIGSDPRDGFKREDAESFDIWINVNDQPSNTFYPARPDQKMFWYPIVESGRWGYGVFYWFKTIMDEFYPQKKQIYVHCAAGAHRGPAMVYWWLVSLGHSRVAAAQVDWRFRLQVCPETGWLATPNAKTFCKESHENLTYQNDIDDGHVPDNLPKLYESMKANPSWGLGGHLANNHFCKTFEGLSKGIYEVEEKNFQKKKEGIFACFQEIKSKFYHLQSEATQEIGKWDEEIVLEALKTKTISAFELRELFEKHGIF